jgi:hypothetical protein
MTCCARQVSAELTLTFSDTPSSLVLAGTVPSTPGPYATAVFDTHADDSSIAAGTVQLTWSVPSTVSGLFVGEAGLQFSGNYTFAGENALALSTVPTFDSAGIKVVGTGNEPFNTSFDFPQSGTTLAHGSPAVFDITGFTIPANNDLSGLLSTNSDGYIGAVHIQGYASSAGIAPTDGQSDPPLGLAVPEPSSIISAATGFVMVVGFYCLRKRRRMSAVAG